MSIDPIPISLLNDFLYCPRRAALKAVEGWREANQHTVHGDLVHEHADLPGYEVAKGVTLLRGLPVWSERLRLSGKCDIVEEHPDGKLVPVEYKKGRRRRFENDDAQLCAQALCLEEMFHAAVPRGAVFHSQSKRRRQVEFNEELRALTERAVAGLRDLVQTESVPAARYLEGQCEECSLFQVCLPRLTQAQASSHTAAVVRRLYEV